jgi:hypothetical protein
MGNSKMVVGNFAGDFNSSGASARLRVEGLVTLTGWRALWVLPLSVAG